MCVSFCGVQSCCVQRDNQHCSTYTESLLPPHPSPASITHRHRVPGFLSLHTHASIAPLRFGSKGGDTLACGGGGREDPIPTKRKTLWYSAYTIISLRTYAMSGFLSSSSLCLNLLLLYDGKFSLLLQQYTQHEGSFLGCGNSLSDSLSSQWSKS